MASVEQGAAIIMCVVRWGGGGGEGGFNVNFTGLGK